MLMNYVKRKYYVNTMGTLRLGYRIKYVSRQLHYRMQGIMNVLLIQIESCLESVVGVKQHIYSN